MIDFSFAAVIAYRREFQLNDPRKRVLMRFSVYLGISMIKSAGNKVYFAHFKAVLQCPTCTWWLVSPEVSSAAVLVVGLFLSFSVCLGRCRWLAFPCIRSLPSHLAQGRCLRRTIFWCWPGVCLAGRRSTGYARHPWAHAITTQAPHQIHPIFSFGDRACSPPRRSAQPPSAHAAHGPMPSRPKHHPKSTQSLHSATRHVHHRDKVHNHRLCTPPMGPCPRNPSTPNPPHLLIRRPGMFTTEKKCTTAVVARHPWAHALATQGMCFGGRAEQTKWCAR